MIQEQYDILKNGVEYWNDWREQNNEVKIDLEGASLQGADLKKINLNCANLKRTNLTGANLEEANLEEASLTNCICKDTILKKSNLRNTTVILRWNVEKYIDTWNYNDTNLSPGTFKNANLENANLSGSFLKGVDFSEANLEGANFEGANFCYARFINANLKNVNLYKVELRSANLENSNLENAIIKESNLEGASLFRANIDGCYLTASNIHGINIWNLSGEFEIQKDLIITPIGSIPEITVNDIYLAQYVYYLIITEKIYENLDATTARAAAIIDLTRANIGQKQDSNSNRIKKIEFDQILTIKKTRLIKG